MEKSLDKKLRYDIVLCDADETLFDFRLAEHDAFKATMESVGIEYSDELLKLYSKINLSYWKKLERNEVSREDLKRLRYEDLFREIGVSGIDCYALNDVYLENLSKSSTLIPGAYEFVEKLSKFCKVIIITNGLVKAQTGRLAGSGLKPFIHNMYISEEVGISKPDKGYFDYVFEKENITDLKRVIVLGDSLSSDMLGGRNAGVDTCKFNRDGIIEESDLCDYQITSFDEFFDILFS